MKRIIYLALATGTLLSQPLSAKTEVVHFDPRLRIQTSTFNRDHFVDFELEGEWRTWSQGCPSLVFQASGPGVLWLYAIGDVDDRAITEPLGSTLEIFPTRYVLNYEGKVSRRSGPTLTASSRFAVSDGPTFNFANIVSYDRVGGCWGPYGVGSGCPEISSCSVQSNECRLEITATTGETTTYEGDNNCGGTDSGGYQLCDRGNGQIFRLCDMSEVK